MKLPHRRQFLQLAAAALPAVSRFAWAQAYPTRPVRVIVPFAPAGDTDLVARLMGQWLSERLGQQFIIENRPGASGNIATEAVVRAPPDGLHASAVEGSGAKRPLAKGGPITPCEGRCRRCQQVTRTRVAV